MEQRISDESETHITGNIQLGEILESPCRRGHRQGQEKHNEYENWTTQKLYFFYNNGEMDDIWLGVKLQNLEKT